MNRNSKTPFEKRLQLLTVNGRHLSVSLRSGYVNLVAYIFNETLTLFYNYIRCFLKFFFC